MLRLSAVRFPRQTTRLQLRRSFFTIGGNNWPKPGTGKANGVSEGSIPGGIKHFSDYSRDFHFNKTFRQVEAYLKKGIEDPNTLIQAIHEDLRADIEKMKAEISKSHAAFKTSCTQLQNALADLESSVRILVWQVSILLVGATLVVGSLVQKYGNEYLLGGKEPPPQGRQ